jgi:hypothetical protein
MRNSSLKTQIIYFTDGDVYNPQAWSSSEAVHDDEFICDAVTVSVTKTPAALIGALSAFIIMRGGSGGLGG